MRNGRVDAHHHLWDVRRREYAWMDGDWADPIRRAFTPDDLRAVTARHGIAQTVLVQAVGDEDETRELLAAAAECPLIAGVVGWVDLTAPDVADRIDALREAPGGEALVGIRHQVQDEPDPAWLLREDVLAGLLAVAEAGLVYDLLVKPPQLAAAAAVAGRLPELRFVVDHIAKPPIARGEFQPWADGLAELARHDNVACKVSGLITEADWRSWTVDQLRPYVDHVVASFGEDRLLFGSDWPVCLLAGSYDQVVEAAETLLAGLPEDKVFGGNARRVYGLPPVPEPAPAAPGS